MIKERLIKPDILIVEDDPIDRQLIEIAFKEVGDMVSLYFCENGVLAIDFLKNTGNYTNMPRPSACLIDINMPGISGIELLSFMKQDESLRSIPVTMFSSSDQHDDVERCYSGQACGYVKKPDDNYEMMKIASTLTKYWAEIIIFPQGT